ncbi:hypothetical protein [Rheinheimera sp.]|uniref:hypothetical protein n=1 Tax=Rheinheimera sp. TaxID=1869214 RepID=UPI0027BA4A1B|nr:hypothetical protein [Rheinheimera sp.]
MKKVLWFIVLVLALATLSDHPVLLPYKQQLYAKFSDSTQNASKVKSDQSIRAITTRFAEIGADLGKGQQAELAQVASSTENILEFYQRYCIEKQFHPQFYGDSIKQVCRVIENNRSGLKH